MGKSTLNGNVQLYVSLPEGKYVEASNQPYE